MCACLTVVAAAHAGGRQTDPAELDALVQAGEVEALAARLGANPAPDGLRLLALAETRRAVAIAERVAREEAFQAARQRFDRWIAALRRNADSTAPPRHAVDLARAHLALANMIYQRWAAADLDRYEITNGRQDLAGPLTTRIDDALRAYERTRELLAPLVANIAAGQPDTEQQYLLLGILDAVPQLDTQAGIGIGWCRLWLARLRQKPPQERTDNLAAAEHQFQAALGRSLSPPARATAELGLAETLREQHRYEPARAHYAAARQADDDARLRARVRCAAARCEIEAGRFGEAHALLRPLVELDPANLQPDMQPARFYVNFAQLWDAYSYLLEADALAHDPSATTIQAVRKQAQTLREQGLVRLNRLADRGGPWPELIRGYVAGRLDLSRPIDSLSPGELLFAARAMSAKGDEAAAQKRLLAASQRQNLSADLAGDVLVELGRSLLRTGDKRAAAAAFDRCVREAVNHPRAPDAAVQAARVWAEIAQQSGQRSDYNHLAGALRALLQRFPVEARRIDAAWWLPVAYQAAGQYPTASARFANVPPSSPHWEEAQYRRVVCARLAWERGGSDATQARRVAGALRDYAVAAHARAGSAPSAAQVRRWAADALVQAAEVWLTPGVDDYAAALKTIEAFDPAADDPSLAARVVAVRIMALRGRGQADKAAEIAGAALEGLDPVQAGAVLELVARSMIDELEQIEQVDDHAASARRASSVAKVLERVLSLARDAQRPAETLEALEAAIVRAHLLAGEWKPARALLDNLLARHPRRGSYRLLDARLRTAAVDGGDRGGLTAAKQAWGRLLQDGKLLERSADTYWEARYNWLRLTLSEGDAKTVRRAIEQERIWRPALGGARWKKRFEQLTKQAGGG